MVNSTLVANVTSAIGNAFTTTIGKDTTFGLAIVGVVVLCIFIYWIFSSGIGIWGLAVIIPPLILILSFIPGQQEKSLSLFPSWVGAIVWILVGGIWGLILLRFFREA